MSFLPLFIISFVLSPFLFFLFFIYSRFFPFFYLLSLEKDGPRKRWSHPGLNWGPKNQNLTCYHYTMEPTLFFLSFLSSFYSFSPLFTFLKKGTIGFEPMTTGTAVLCSTAELCALLFFYFFFSSSFSSFFFLFFLFFFLLLLLSFFFPSSSSFFLFFSLSFLFFFFLSLFSFFFLLLLPPSSPPFPLIVSPPPLSFFAFLLFSFIILFYFPLLKNALRGARTHDLTVKSRTLYRLS